MSESDAHLSNTPTPSEEVASQSAPKQEAAAQPTSGSSAPSKRSGLDLSDLKIMPAWVSDFGKEPAARAREYDDADRPSQRGDSRRGGDAGRGGRSFGQGSPSAPRGDRPPFRRPEGGDRNERGGPRPPRTEGGFRGRDRDRRHGDAPPQREWVDTPKDINASVHPEDKSLDALSAHIRSTGHAFSLFDVSRLVLAGSERFGVRFLCNDKRTQPLYRVVSDGALFLTREEALQHILRGPALETYYRVEQIELEEPKGNFPSVAVCGFSGEILGPASHHSFQTSIIRFHRERFSNLSLEDYKRRIRTETNPELIQKWKDLQRKATRWLPLSAELESAPTPAPEPEPASPTPAADSGENTESAEEVAATPSSDSAATLANAIATRQEVELHFKRHHSEQAVVEVRDITVAGNIDKKQLSPGLFILLRQAVEGARKHLFEMSQRLSAGFDRRGLKTFKRRSGKMFVCRVRPKAIDPSTLFAERVTAIVDHLKKAPGGLQLTDLLNALTKSPQSDPASTPPAEPESPSAAETLPTTQPLTDEQLATLKDLRWLANEGYIIEYSDGLVTLGVQGEMPAQIPTSKKSPPATEPTSEPAAESPVASDPVAEEPITEAPSPDALPESAETTVSSDPVAEEPITEAPSPDALPESEETTEAPPTEETTSSPKTPDDPLQ
jgi:hypothetical protein